MFTETERPSWSGTHSLLRASARAAAGFLFPSRCLACGVHPVEELFRGGVCERCWELLPEPRAPRCGVCDEALGTQASRCGRCLADPPEFTHLCAAAPYLGSARGILLAFKFRGADYLAPHLAAVMARRLSRAGPVEEVAAVPARRGAAGGYRPAALLAAAVAKALAKPFAPRGIEAARKTRRQSGLPAEERAANVRGAFRARRGRRRVLLVDDVATSGATARECARVLMRAGAESVEVWCFARASRTDFGFRISDFGLGETESGEEEA